MKKFANSLSKPSIIKSKIPSFTSISEKDIKQESFTRFNREKIEHQELEEQGQVIFSPKVSLKVWYLLSQIQNLEFSGALFFKVVKGNIINPSEFQIHILDFFLMDIGTQGFTSFKWDESITEY